MTTSKEYGIVCTFNVDYVVAVGINGFSFGTIAISESQLRIYKMTYDGDGLGKKLTDMKIAFYCPFQGKKHRTIKLFCNVLTYFDGNFESEEL